MPITSICISIEERRNFPSNLLIKFPLCHIGQGRLPTLKPILLREWDHSRTRSLRKKTRALPTGTRKWSLRYALTLYLTKLGLLVLLTEKPACFYENLLKSLSFAMSHTEGRRHIEQMKGAGDTLHTGGPPSQHDIHTPLPPSAHSCSKKKV